MTDYLNYPEINNINDVLPHIEKYDEITLSEKNGYTCICYNIQTPELFDIKIGDEYGSLIRRECRGLLFNSATGNIISRPFEKFFNLEEKPETQSSNISLNDDHRIEEKIDGSMVRVFSLDENDKLRFGTKRGETDISNAAEEYVKSAYDTEFFDWLEFIVRSGMTPIFEWVSQESRVVIDYKKKSLILLAVRNNKTGQYYTNLDDLSIPASVPIVNTVSTGSDDLDTVVSIIKNMVNQEGIVLYFPYKNQRIKVKSDWYISIHRMKELLVQDRHLILTALDNKLDDALAVLPEQDKNEVLEKVNEFWKNVYAKVAWLDQQIDYITGCYYDANLGTIDKKKLSIEYMHQFDKQTQNAIYTMINKNVSSFDYVVSEARKHAERSATNYKTFYDTWLST